MHEGHHASGHQYNQAGRDVNAPHGDQTVINDNRRVELVAGAVPQPAAVGLYGPVRGLPRPPVRVFEGRAAALNVLEAGMSARRGALVTQAVYGLGGIGKSELALQYAFAHRADYPLVWWITATNATQMERGLAELARQLCPAITVTGTTADAAAWAAGWLQAHDEWLLIMDDVEDPAQIEPLLGQAGGGHVIITSRRDTDWTQLADPVQLDVLDPAAAARVLIARAGQDRAEHAEAAAGIAEELGYLPLALSQAAAYIAQRRITCASYLDSLRRNPARMHAVPGTAADSQRTVARLWDLHITTIRYANPDALRLLGVLARYAPEAIPREMLGGGASREDTDEALSLLASYSMIMLTAETVSIHRLLQTVILTKLDDTYGARSLRSTALDWVYLAIPDDLQTNMAGWPLARALVPHVEALASDFPPGEHSVALGRVLHVIALFLNSQGDYARASELGQSALAITEKAEGPDHIDTAMSLANLGLIYLALGQAADALPLAEQALTITQATLGANHPTFASRLDDLAATYRNLGRAADALPLAERALAITEKALGPDHLNTAAALSHLGGTYGDLGRSVEAVSLAERALTITEKALGPDHPRTAGALANLAGSYQALGPAADTLPLAERALTITEKALGPDHPRTAGAVSQLASIYLVLGRAAEALPLAEQALGITDTALGPNHPDTAARMSSLAVIFMSLGRAADALPLAERALAITKATLGPDHPDTTLRMSSLAGTYLLLGRAADALPLAERALAIMGKTLGSDHPQTIIALDLLVSTYTVLDRAVDALPLAERALAITQATFGPRHRNTAIALGNVAGIYSDIGRAADALPLAERALAITEATLGPNHPDTAGAIASLTLIRRILGK